MSVLVCLAQLFIVRSDGSRVVVWLLGAPNPDLSVVDVIARLQLEVQRDGGHMQLGEVSASLTELLELTGLGRQLGWQIEGGKKILDIEKGMDG